MKNILITGSTDGIGKLAAINLAKQGHNIYLHGRSADKLEQAVNEVSAVATGTVSGFIADLSELAQVKKMADEVNNRLDKLDVLINNAGVFKVSAQSSEQSVEKSHEQSVDGLDLRFAVNYFAPVLLTQELLPLLAKAGKTTKHARIINVSSAAQAPVAIPALLGQTAIDVQASYAQSKLALTIWSFDLAKQVKADNIAIIAVNPGSLLNTRMATEAYGTHWSSADKGGNILAELATADEFEAITGQYFDNDLGDPRGNFGNAHPDASNETKAAELAQATQQVLAKFV